MKHATLGEKYYIHSLITTLVLFLFYFFGINTSVLYTSILDYKNVKSDIFDGAVYPIEFVPNPMELSYTQRKQKYDEIDSKYFIKTPLYNPTIFGKDIQNLKTGTSEYAQTVTQRLIFTVPYMSTYNFDYKEYSGSHPGIDIIAPEGTPVKNIAAGVVVDTGYQPGGFGNYVLIKHNNVTLPNGTTGDVYSLYAHLQKGIALVGTKIKKGETIGYVGQTGTATTSHLHFQMDLATAPFSPYWPFTTSEMKVAQVGFFDAINIGLGKENALSYTINPLKFVNEHLYVSPLVMNSNEAPSAHPLVETATGTAVQSDVPASQTGSEVVQTLTGSQKTPELPVTQNNTETGIEVPQNTGVQVIKKEEMIHSEVELLSALKPELVLSDSSAITLLNEKNNLIALNNDDLSSSLDKINQNQDDILNTNTDETLLLPDSQDKQSLPLVSSSGETLGTQTGELMLSETGSIGKIFTDIENNYQYFSQIKYFKDNNIITGFVDGSFRPKNNITRIESLKIILLANKIAPIRDKDSKYTDISTNSWENTYVNAALEAKILASENKYFSPFRNVSRAEGLKLILNLAGVDLTLNNEATGGMYQDVQESDWYYKYAQYAAKAHLFPTIEKNFYPNKPLTREELVYILYQFIKK